MTDLTNLTVAQALLIAGAAGVDRLDATLLLAHALQRPRTWLLAHDDAVLDAAQPPIYRAALARRADGEPLAYLLGRKEFRGLDLQVDHHVLVPRPDTELLVEWALELLSCEPGGPPPQVIDLGTGSGAIALAVKQARPAVAVTATDVSPEALALAQRNAVQLALKLEFRLGSWWQAVPGKRYGLALSNPPYIAADDPHLAALRHEPRAALTPGGDGLSALTEIALGAPAFLEAGAWLLLEHGHDQGAAVRDLLQRSGFHAVQSRVDLAGHERCTGGHR